MGRPSRARRAANRKRRRAGVSSGKNKWNSRDPSWAQTQAGRRSLRAIKNLRTVAFGTVTNPEFDPNIPAAYPLESQADLLGEMPVRLRAEDEALVAYGFGGQRVAIPASSIRQVIIHPGFE